MPTETHFLKKNNKNLLHYEWSVEKQANATSSNRRALIWDILPFLPLCNMQYLHHQDSYLTFYLLFFPFHLHSTPSQIITDHFPGHCYWWSSWYDRQVSHHTLICSSLWEYDEQPLNILMSFFYHNLFILFFPLFWILFWKPFALCAWQMLSK